MQEHFRVDVFSLQRAFADEQNLNKEAHGGGMPAFVSPFTNVKVSI
jgi:hypothetical protein